MKKKPIYNVDVPYYEAMHRFLVNFAMLAKEKEAKVIAVTSWKSKEGRTSTAVNLAHTMSKTYNARVLLIDLDLRKPDIHKFIGMNKELGIVDFCLSNATPDSVVHKIHYNFDVIPKGQLDALYSKVVLTSDRLNTLLQTARNVYDYIIIDTPPLKLFADLFYLSQLVDTSLLVINQKSARRKNIDNTFKALKKADVPLLGTVLTSAKVHTSFSYRKYGL